MKIKSFSNKEKVVFYLDGKKEIGLIKKVKIRTKTCVIRTPEKDLTIPFENIFHLDINKTLKRM